MVPGVPCVSRGKWEWESDNLCRHVLALRKQPNFQNAVFCEDRFEKIPVLYAHLTYKMMSNVFRMGRSTNSVAWKLAKCAKLILVFYGFRVAIKSSLHVEHWILRYVNLHALFFLLWLARFQPFGPSWFFDCHWTNNTSELTCDFHDVWARDTYLVKFETIINNAEFRKKSWI